MCQPVTILLEEEKVIDYLVEDVDSGHAGDLLVCSCYETVKAYHVTMVFSGRIVSVTRRGLRLFRGKNERGGA